MGCLENDLDYSLKLQHQQEDAKRADSTQRGLLWLNVRYSTPKEIRSELQWAISSLPLRLVRDNRSTQVMVDSDLAGRMERGPDQVQRQWTTRLPLRHQGVIFTAIRGCDGAPKEDPSKSLSRMIRRACLNPADERETEKSGGFFGFDLSRVTNDIHDLLHSLDEYPLHYILHLTHASQVIGYKHPNPEFRDFFKLIYALIVHTFHLNMETESEMDLRLTHDRVAAGTTERNF